MKIEKDVVAGIAYQVRTQEGVLVDEAPVNQPLEYLHGHRNLVEGLEDALEGREIGEKFEVQVEPEDGYGSYNENLVQRVNKNVFEGVDELKAGMRFIADTDLGPLPVIITEVDGDHVTVDGNHMLAGQTLLFTVEVASMREATPDEITHGHVHQAHGHSHGEGECCGGHGHGKGDGECCGGGHGHGEHGHGHGGGECCGGGHHHH